jgi:ankyrin repeat protein
MLSHFEVQDSHSQPAIMASSIVCNDDHISFSRSMLLEFINKEGKQPTNNSENSSIRVLDDSLYFACERHEPDIAHISKIIEKNPMALLTPRDRGWLPIHHAAMANSFNSVQFVLDKSPESASKVQEDGFLPLHMSMYFEEVDLEVVQLILNCYPIGIQHKAKDGRLPLHIAAENSAFDCDLISLLLKHYPDASKETNNAGQLPLHLLLDNKHCHVDSFLLLLDANPNAVSQKDSPPRSKLPLHYAISAAAKGIFHKDTIVDIIKILIGT